MPSRDKKKKVLKSAGTPTVSLNIVNPAVSAVPTTIYSGISASLNVTLSNLTGADIIVTNQSTLEIFMPGYFSAAEVSVMNITGVSAAGWTFSYIAGENALLLTYSGGSGKWTNNTALTFTISNVLSTQTSGNDTVQVNINGLQGGNIPAQISAVLLLSAAAVPSHIDLQNVLLVNTEFDGQIYVSSAIDPLTNSLYLDLKNTGSTPLYNGNAKWSGNPRVTVSFVYGNTSGSLAPDNKQNASQQGSAWSISGAVAVDQTGGWAVNNPSVTGSANSPSWILSPAGTNKQIIGINDQANVSFVFSNIFSFTPTGPTQMYVQFTGFSQSEQNTYNDCVFVVPILKTEAPSTRGVLNFYGQPIYYIKYMEDVPVHLQWSAFQTASVSLVCNAAPPPIPSPYKKSYPNPTPLVYDNTTVLLPDVEPDTYVTFTLDAYRGGGGHLNSKQFLVSVEQKPGIYSFSGPDGVVNYTINKPVDVLLNWNVYRVAMIEIFQGDAKIAQKKYKPSPLRNIDSAQFTMNVSGLTPSQQFTMKAYDAQGVLLETMSFTLDYSANSWCDLKDGKVYPIVRVNNQIWLGANYDYNDPDGSCWYNKDKGNEALYGRLYTYASALRNVPEGWRMPEDADWTSLMNAFGTNYYKALMAGGVSNLNFRCGGTHYGPTPGGSFDNMGTFSCYWGYTSKPNSANYLFIYATPDRFIHINGPIPIWPSPTALDSGYLRFILKTPAADSPDRQEEVESKINLDELKKFLSQEKE